MYETQRSVHCTCNPIPIRDPLRDPIPTTTSHTTDLHPNHPQASRLETRSTSHAPICLQPPNLIPHNPAHPHPLALYHNAYHQATRQQTRTHPRTARVSPPPSSTSAPHASDPPASPTRSPPHATRASPCAPRKPNASAAQTARRIAHCLYAFSRRALCAREAGSSVRSMLHMRAKLLSGWSDGCRLERKRVRTVYECAKKAGVEWCACRKATRATGCAACACRRSAFSCCDIAWCRHLREAWGCVEGCAVYQRRQANRARVLCL